MAQKSLYWDSFRAVLIVLVGNIHFHSLMIFCREASEVPATKKHENPSHIDFQNQNYDSAILTLHSGLTHSREDLRQEYSIIFVH